MKYRVLTVSNRTVFFLLLNLLAWMLTFCYQLINFVMLGSGLGLQISCNLGVNRDQT